MYNILTVDVEDFHHRLAYRKSCQSTTSFFFGTGLAGVKIFGSKIISYCYKKIIKGISQAIKIDKDQGNYNSFPKDYEMVNFFKNKKRLL